MLGLPPSVTACLFDLDGVLTDTAVVHAAAWKQTFDRYLRQRDGKSFVPFALPSDYSQYVDGKPRADGVRDFLASRGITLAEGAEGDSPDADTVNGLGNRKNDELNRRIRQDGVKVFPGSRRYLQAAESAGLHRIVVSSSANTELVLSRTGLDRYVQGRIDGITLEQQHLAGKPAPDSYLAGARLAGVSPDHAAVFEDATAGVAAGKSGRFGFVVGVDRGGQGAALKSAGADVVVHDLADLLDGTS